MAILIKDPETELLIRQLAQRTGQGITEVVRHAVEERLNRLPRSRDDIEARRRRLEAILDEFVPRDVADERSEDEILGYNAHGHFD
jgi:antitoxin VapB